MKVYILGIVGLLFFNAGMLALIAALWGMM